MRFFSWLHSFGQDLRFAARGLRKNPGLVAIVVLSLALGIGANSTIFSVMSAIMYRPLPYGQPDRLMVIWETEQGRPDSREHPPIAEVVDWKKQSHVFEDIALTSFTESTPVAGQGEAENLRAQFVTPNFFHVLGTSPALGRVFLANEAQDRTQTVVLSDSFWKVRFHGDPGVLGKVFNISGVVSTVVGVMPPGFGSFYGDLDMLIPIDPASARYSERKDHWLMAIGRLNPGATVNEAQLEMSVIARRLEQAYPATNKGVGTRVEPLRKALYPWAGRILYPLLGAVGFVLLIACGNSANLMLSRSETRRKEFAVRASLGAGRGRLMQQLFAESALMGVLGGVCGAALTSLSVQVFRVWAADFYFPNIDRVGIDGRVLLFTLAVSLLTAILVGCVPALQASNPDLNLTLREGDRRTGTGSRRRTRHILAVSEIALAMVLLVGAGLMIRSIMRLREVNPGFDSHDLLTFEFDLPEGGNYIQRVPGGDIERATPQVAAFYRQLLENVSAIPGVSSVCIVSPMGVFERTFSILGRPFPPADRRPVTRYTEISSAYFSTLKIPLKKGRDLTEADRAGAPWAAVVNETFVRRYFPNGDPIGQHILLRFIDFDETQPRQIVGVVGDIKMYLGQTESEPMVYASYQQQPSDFRGGSVETHLAQTLVVRTAASLKHGGTGLAEAVKKATAEIDPEQPVTEIMTMDQMLARGLGDSQFYASLLEVFAFIALLLAVIGIYGSMSYIVSERTREIGIRVALGASRAGILKLINAMGLKLAVIGVVIGIALAAGLTRFIAGFLFGVTATDPLTFAVVGMGLIAVAMLACYIPAYRATKVDPMVALRYE
jgi:putative ABC transport system permease protein